jgi:hypothetical protein
MSPLNVARATYRMDVVAQAVLDVLTTASATLNIDPSDMYYGDQKNIPRTPSLCIEPSHLERSLDGASIPPRTRNEFDVIVYVYLYNLTSVQQLSQDKDKLLDDVADVLHFDWTINDTVIFGHCRSSEYGYSLKANSLVRSGKIAWRGMTKSPLTSNNPNVP